MALSKSGNCHKNFFSGKNELLRVVEGFIRINVAAGIMNKDVTKVWLLMNLGSPDSTSVPDLRKYLTQFLMDGKVIDIPYFLRLLLVRGIIVPFRAPKSAEKYKSIWTKDGSPLIHISKQLQQAVGAAADFPVELAMRYGKPDVASVLNNIAAKYPNVQEVCALPLYPHYAMSSFETAVDHAKEVHAAGGFNYKLSFISPFYKEEQYINALAESIRPYIQQDFDRIIFSYHGIPERHVKKTDMTGKHCLAVNDCCSVPSQAHTTCYRHQVITTTNLVAQQLNIPKDKFCFSFQSRLGQDAWLKPYTAAMLKELPSQGVKKVLVVCPAFVSDCLETIEEMGEEGREIFTEAGGESFTLIPCLNTNQLWIDTVVSMMNKQ